MGANDWQINGNVILAPTTGRWVPRRPLGIQGDNRPIYPAVRQFEMRWQLTDNEDWSNVQYFFNQLAASGTATARLPQFPTITGSAFAWQVYSGVTMQEPTIGPFFEEHPKSVVLLITNITVE